MEVSLKWTMDISSANFSFAVLFERIVLEIEFIFDWSGCKVTLWGRCGVSYVCTPHFPYFLPPPHVLEMLSLASIDILFAFYSMLLSCWVECMGLSVHVSIAYRVGGYVVEFSYEVVVYGVVFEISI